MKNNYEILGISANATKDEIKKAYRELTDKMHIEERSANAQNFRDIQDAYNVLYFEESRAKYDLKYQAHISKQSVKKKFFMSDFMKLPMIERILKMPRKRKKQLGFILIGAAVSLLIYFGGLMFFAKKKELQRDFRQEGMEKFSQGSFQEASDLLEKSSEEEKNPEVLLKLGAAYYNQRKYDEAIQIYEKIIAEDNENALAFNSLANAYRDKKDNEKAIDAYKKAIKLSPLSPLAYSNLAILLMDLNQSEEARATIKEGLANIPDSQELKNIKTYLDK